MSSIDQRATVHVPGLMESTYYTYGCRSSRLMGLCGRSASRKAEEEYDRRLLQMGGSGAWLACQFQSACLPDRAGLTLCVPYRNNTCHYVHITNNGARSSQF